MRRFLSLAAVVLLSGCNGMSSTGSLNEVPVSEDAASLKIELRAEQTPSDGSEAAEVRYSLDFSGALSEKVELFSLPVESALNRLPTSMLEGTNVIAAFENYMPGGGMQLAVERRDDTIIVKQRVTSEGTAEESGGCAEWIEVVTFAVPAGTEISWTDSQEESENMVISCPL